MKCVCSLESAPIKKLLTMANQICRIYGLPVVTRRELAPKYRIKQVYRAQMSPVIMRRNDAITLWVDRWYLAVQIGTGNVEYLYLTRFHIAEEKESYAELAESRDDAACLPEEIAEQFDQAIADMDADGDAIWFKSDRRKKLPKMKGVA